MNKILISTVIWIRKHTILHIHFTLCDTLSASTFPLSPQFGSDMEQVAAITAAQGLAIDSDTFVSALEHPVQCM